MLHEADLIEYGIGSTGLTTVEHVVPRSEDAGQSNTYSNCLYACRWCNRSRSKLPLHDGNGNVLLNPTTSAWADHFELRDDKLAPKTGSGEYTEMAYSINAPFKVQRRAARRELIERCRKLVLEAPAILEKLSRVVGHLAATDALDEAEEVRWHVRRLNDEVALARQALERYQGVPVDADKACRCRPGPTMPPQIAEQLIDI